MKNFKSNLKQTVRAFPLLVVMLLCSSAVMAVPGWSNTNMSARQSTADELSDRQPSSAWQPSYQGYQSQIFEVGTTNVPSDYSEISSESSGSHKVGPRKLGGGTDPGEQSENSPIGEPWIMLLFALLTCGVIAYRKMNMKHNKNMKNTILNQLYSSCKKWKTLMLLGAMLLMGINTAWAWSFNGTNHFYIENKGGWTDSKIQMVIGKGTSSGYTSCYNDPTKITNTLLIYKSVTVNGWSDASFMGFMGNSSNWGGGSWGRDNITNNATHYALYTSGVDASDGQEYMLTPSSSSNTTTVSLNYLGNSGYSDLNKTVTIRAKVSTDGGSNYSNANTPGKLAASSKVFTSYTSCAGTTGASATLNAGSSSTTLKTGYTANTSVTAASVTGYDFVGWYEESSKILSTSSGTMNPHGAVTLYAYYKVKQYTVSYGVNSSTRNGSIKLNSGSAVTTTSSSTLNHGTAIAFTATPNTNYQVEGWYSDAACSAGNRLQAGGTSYDAGTLTAAKTVYVKFEEKTGGIVTLNAGSNGQVSLDNSSWGATKTKTNITTNTAFNIYAKGNSGYHFTSWTKNSGSGTIGSTSTANTTFTPVAYEDASLTAAFAETKSTITVTTATTSWGSLKFGSTAKSWGTTASLGVETTQSITATAASGYKFVRWDLSGAAASSSTLTGATITLKADGSGSTGTATAVFEEDLSTPYIVTGGNKIVTSGSTWRTTADQYNKILKATGHSTESIGYFTVPVTATNTGESNSNYQFKIYKTTATTNYYGLTASGQYYLTRDQDNGKSRTLSTSGANIELRADITGDYLIKVDYSTPASPAITVYFPLAVTWTAASVYSGDAATIAATVNDIESGKSIKFDVYAGATATGTVLATWSGTTSSTSHTQNLSVTPSFGASDNSKQYTVKVTYDGSQTATYTSYVYRKWDIYVNDVCSWGAMKLYNWDASGSYPVAFPGTAQPLVDGSTHWYKVTLDARYPNFKLSKQSGTESSDHTASISTYGAGTYWYLNNCQTLTSVSITTPTVTLSATVTNATQINLTGNITNFGGDGSKASEMKEVYFKVNNVKDAASITASTTDGKFTKSLSNPTPDATNNTLQAFATNIGYTGSSSAVRFTRVTLDKQSGTGGTTTILAVNGSAMASDVTAPTRDGYVFGGYFSEEDGAGTKYYDSRMNSAHNWDQTTATKTLYAKWTARTTFDVYFYNKDNWSPVYAYLWNWGDNRWEKAWPGTEMTEYQSKIFKHSYESAEDFNYIKFNDGTDAHKTGDLTLPAMNQMFYNPEGSGEWTQYIMVANFPTTKQAAAVGAKISIEPVVAWADGISFQQISITATRDSGSTAITASVAGTKLIVTGTAAGTAKYTIRYTYSTTTIEKVIRFQYLEGLTIQAKIATDDSKWTDDSKVKIHFWGTGIANSDIPMTFAKTESGYNYFQAIIPKGTDNKANFLFFYDYMEDTDANRWRQTANQTNVTTEKCYTIAYASSTSTKSNCTSTTGLCADSWQVRIVMGSGNIYTSNAVAGNTEVISFFAPGASESQSYRQGTVTLEHNGATVATLAANTFSSSGVYTAKVKTSSPYGLTDLALYTGDYYIRTNGADGGWDNYKTNPDNLMTEFTRNTNFPNETFSYYWVKNVAKNKTENIKATVANDYNPVLCNFTADETANATDGVNLRFGYEPTTNDIVRGIIGGATTNNFLNIICADGSQVYKEMACTTLLDETLYASSPGDSKFQDKSNWVYEVIVYAKIDVSHPVANVVLKSYYNGINYLLGMVKDSYGRETSTPVSFPVIKTGTTPGVYGLRVVYDFKTNRLFAAWAPADRVIDGVLDVDADVMFLRHEDGDAAQISFKTTSSEIVDIKQAIFALELDNEKGSNIERHYFISLPFDCKVSNIFGIGGFMNYWGIQRYNGAKRAQIGWFQETPTFWEWLSADDVMQAGEGYLLSVDKKALQNDGVWKDGIVYQKQETIINPATGKPYKAVDGTDSVAWVTYTDGSLLTMYFPSTTSGFTITPATGEALTLTYPDQPCSITREDRDKKDSNWKCIGTPGYKNITISNYSQSSPELVENAAPNFLYVFNEQTSGAQYAKGTYSVTNGRTFTYHSFNSYMVQFAGTVDWAQYSKGTEVSPIAPKRIVAAEEKTTDVQLNLMGADNNELDRTFVWMRENATIGFDQNYDLNKMIENKANQIYSFAENDIPFAANVLPLGTDTVKLVVNIANDGEFSFSVDADKHVGMAPVLYDMYQMTETDLLSADYTIDLKKGKYEDRFFLIFKAAQPIVTSFETTADGGQNVHSSEAIYDVLGRRVNTIYPGHLYIVNGEKRIAR